MSTLHLLRSIEVTGLRLRRALKDLAKEGRTGDLLDLTKKEGLRVRRARVLGPAAGGGRERSLLTLLHREMV